MCKLFFIIIFITKQITAKGWPVIVKLHAYTGVFKFVDKDFKGMREVNLEPWQAEFEATDHAVIKLYMYTPPEGELTSLAIGL